ncbi:MAG: hypothetical protein IPP47_22140 [Bryobacterales bacterium]|nr:hypothetical protein [Bryobacterales bacterium]
MRLKEVQANIERQQILRFVERAREQFNRCDLDGARLSLARASAINADDPDVAACWESLRRKIAAGPIPRDPSFSP